MRFPGQMAVRRLKLLVRALDQLLGTIPTAILANRKLSSRIALLADSPIPSTDPRHGLSLELMQTQFDVDMKRLARLEEKARATVLGVTLSVSLVSPCLGFLTASTAKTGGLRLPFVALLCSAVFFLLASGFLAVSGYRADRVFRPGPEDHQPLVSLAEERETLLRCLDLNNLSILKKNNLLSASIDTLRNGLAAVLGLLLLMALSSL